MNWIKIDKNEKGAIPDGICCWCFDFITNYVIFFDEDDFIESGRFTHYMQVEKPLPPDF